MTFWRCFHFGLSRFGSSGEKLVGIFNVTASGGLENGVCRVFFMAIERLKCVTFCILEKNVRRFGEILFLTLLIFLSFP